jgi:hypothetical protein
MGYISRYAENLCIQAMVRWRTLASSCRAVPWPPQGKVQRLTVEHTYDLFEVFPDGSPLWRESVAGHETALSKLKELSARTTNEVRVIDLRTNAVVAALNTPQP